MAKFKVGDSNRSIFDIGNHHVYGGTWYSSNDVGVSERVLRKDFPFLVWDGPFVEEVKVRVGDVKVVLPKEVVKPKKVKR